MTSTPTFSDVWGTFKETTTAHGIPHVTRARGPIKTTFWSVMLVATLAFLTYNITTITLHFFDYPVTVNIQLLHKSQMTFPAVTICNMNPVKKSAWEAALLETAGLTAVSNRKRKKRDAVLDVSCPQYWIAYNGSCYNLTRAQVNYTVAESLCDSEGASVVDILSEEEQDFITNTWSSENTTLWIGLGFRWFWVTGKLVTEVGFVNWLEGQPKGDGYCAHTAYGGQWNDRRCPGTRPYVCEKPVYANGSCDEGAIMYNDTCYLKSNDSLPAEVAMDFCVDIGGHLVTIETQGEQDVIANFTYYFEDKFWIGLELDSIWWNGNMASYRNWVDGQPRDAAALCVVMDMLDGKWIERLCSKEDVNGFICKKQENEPTTTGYPETTVISTAPTTDVTSSPPEYGQPNTTAGAEVWSTTNSPPDAVELDEPSCCCSCCYHNDDGTVKSCDTCGSGCLLASLASLINTSTSVPPPPPSEPEPIPGSRYPERPQTTEAYQETEAVTETLAELPLMEKENMGYTAEDFIVDCQFAGATCQMTNFEKFYNPVHGNCFIFNSGWNSSMRLYESYKTGRRHGLQLVLNIDQDEYIKETGDTAGARLVVHTQNSMPFPEDEGITVTPGQATSIGVRQLMIRRQGPPYGDCITILERNASRNAYELVFPVTYRPTACSKTCYQRNVIAECQCKDPYYPINDEAYGVRNVSVCRTSDVIQGDCRYEVTKKFEKNELECYCPNACEEIIFVLSASTAEWPSDVQKSNILTKYYSKAPSLFMDPADPEKYKRNLLKVEVFYEEFNFELMQEKPAYYTGNYLSDLGGVLGLWLGCSILTLIEFLELIMDLFAVCVMRHKCQNRCKSKAPSNTSNVVKVAPSPSPVDNAVYVNDKDYFISGGLSKFDMDLSQFPKAFQSYMEETRLEHAEKEMARKKGALKKTK